MVNKAYQWRN